MSEMCLVTCGHCSETFSADESKDSLARCPHCRKKSSIGTKYAHKAALRCIIGGLWHLCLEVGMAAEIIEPPARMPGGINAAYATLSLIALACFAYAYYIYHITVSVVSSNDPV